MRQYNFFPRRTIMTIALRALPEQVLIETFSYLKKPELASCCQISRNWRKLASTDRLWKEIGKHMFEGSLNVPNIKEFLREFVSQEMSSNEEIMDRLEAFFNR